VDRLARDAFAINFVHAISFFKKFLSKLILH
jgi:hypothetical protein